jgi:hypothetical protein
VLPAGVSAAAGVGMTGSRSAKPRAPPVTSTPAGRCLLILGRRRGGARPATAPAALAAGLRDDPFDTHVTILILKPIVHGEIAPPRGVVQLGRQASSGEQAKLLIRSHALGVAVARRRATLPADPRPGGERAVAVEAGMIG